MNIKFIKNFISFLILVIVLSGCAVNKNKTFKHDTPLIKEDIQKIGREEVQKTVEMGPQPSLGEAQKLTKRKIILSGILNSQTESVINAYKPWVNLIEIEKSEDWVLLYGEL